MIHREVTISAYKPHMGEHQEKWPIEMRAIALNEREAVEQEMLFLISYHALL